MSVTEIKSCKIESIEEAKELLTQVMEMGFVSVTIIGESGDGLLHIKESHTSSVQNKLGALEIAKHQLLKGWE